jgi:polyhydroxybutyrate depolymerase
VIFIEVDGREREYALYVPESLDTENPAPLVFNLHGRGSDRFQQSIYGGFLPLADRDGVLLVHPQGIVPEGQTAQQWNFAQFFDTSYSDEEFLLAVIEDVAEQVCVDRNRIFSTGMSSGGMMSSTLACLHGDVFAAVAPVAASIYLSDRCGGGPEVPFLTFHGTNDQVVAFGEPFDIAGVAESWAEHNGCELAADEEQIGDVTKREFDCDDDAETAIYVVDGGGHTWPGSPIEIGAPGDTTQDVSATELIWEFFARHTLDDN